MVGGDKMEIIKDNTLDEYLKYAVNTFEYTCPHCGSLLKVTQKEVEEGICPCCDEYLKPEISELEEDEEFPKLFRDKISVKDDKFYVFDYSNGKHVTEDEVDKMIKQMIDTIKKNYYKDGEFLEYLYTATGDTFIVAIYDNEEKAYYFYVANNGYKELTTVV